MKTELMNEILKKWINGLSKEKALTKIFLKVRDIPYGTIGSRDPEQVYFKNRGTCSGKHILFYELVTTLGFKVRQFVSLHKFNQSKIKFSPSLQEMLKENDVLDYTHFVKILVGDKWLAVNLTWDLPLKKYGFPVYEWDGKSDTQLYFVPIETWEVKDSEKFKEEKIALMSKKEQKIRKLFIQKLSEWVSTLR
jgi:hypothetical protein